MAKQFNRKGKAPVKEQKEYEEEVIQIDRVTRVVKGGRRLRFRATVVVGNKKGKVGVGVGKSVEVTGAISKAIAQGKKNLIEVPLVEGTIPHQLQIKFKSANIKLMPACPGTGIKAGGSVRKVLELAGVTDILSKSLGAKNRLNNSLATVKALGNLKPIPWLKKKSNPIQAAGTLAETKPQEKQQNAGQKNTKPIAKSAKAAPKANKETAAKNPAAKNPAAKSSPKKERKD